MEPTRELLQEEILEILYQKCSQKPVWVTCSEIFWNIQNIKVTERSVRDVLEWLVKNDLVIYQADKYQISKREFIDMSKRKAQQEKEMRSNENAEEKPVAYAGVSMSDEYKNMNNKNMHKSNIFFIAIALVAFLLSGALIGILFFNHYVHEKATASQIVEMQDSIHLQTLQMRNMGYLKDEFVINRNFKNISTSLGEQQAINKEIQNLFHMQQEQINNLIAYNKKQTYIIEQNQKEMYIYLWIIGVAVLVASSLLVAWYGRRNQ